MEGFLVLLVLYLIVVLLVLPLWSFIKIRSHDNVAEELRRRIGYLEEELKTLRATVRNLPATPAPAKPTESVSTPVAAVTPVVPAVAPPVVAAPPAVVEPEELVTPPVFPAAVSEPSITAIPEPVVTPTEASVASDAPPMLEPAVSAAAAPPKPSAPPPIYTPPPRQPSWTDNINWEQFMGAKLFAWLGGLALFLGVAFFVKYSFEHGWIPPEVRVGLGFALGAGLVVGGLKIAGDKYRITSQTLVATGIVSLYAVTFACRSIYKFEFFGPVPTFLLMTLITATAFILAVRLEAQVVAVLGILGGFLTPKLLSTGVDNPVGLFGYIALLDVGLIAVALHRSWFYLVPLGAAGTVIMEIGWADQFYAPEKTISAMIVCLGFSALFIGAVEAAQRWQRRSPLLGQTAIFLPSVAFCFAWYFLDHPAVAARTWLFFGYVFLVNVCYFVLAWRENASALVGGAAAATALLLVRWAGVAFTGELTTTAMAACLLFCGVFLAVYFAAGRLGRSHAAVLWSAVGLPVLALGFVWYFLDFPEVANRTGLLFGFVFLASLFVFIVAWREGLGRLVTAVAGITTVLMIRWTGNTFTAAQVSTVVIVCLAFCAVYLGVYLLARWKERANPPVMWTAVGMPMVAFAFALFLLGNPAAGARPGLIFSFILLADLVLLTLAWLDERLPRLHLVAGLLVFALLSVWTAEHLTDALLPWALAVYLLFAALHTVFPQVLERKRPVATPTWWSQLFPPLALLLMLLPIVKLPGVSLLIWPAILLVDLLAIGLAVLSASLVSVAAVLILTLIATGACLFKVPVATVFAPSLLLVIGGFAVFFFAASLWLVNRLGDKVATASNSLNRIFGDTRAQLPAFSSLLPFLLLIMACSRLTIPNPAALFGLGLLLVILTLGLARLLVIEWLPACALAGMGALEHVWHARQFTPDSLAVPLFSYLVFYGIFSAYPFVFQRTFVGLRGPWAVAALSGVVHFPLVYWLVQKATPNDFMGLIPAAFALAPLASLLLVLNTVPAEEPRRLSQLAWFGGVTLFFITLIFPIQFERQWLTVAWALEGAALLWLFHRVPHRGLPAVGAVLLVTAFARLALNPAVLEYHVRSQTPVFNWYLYAYGLTVAALFTGARLAACPEPVEGAPPRERVLGINVVPLFNTLGTILAFLLLNIEIADYFTTPGARTLTFQFSGNFARDMSYTIGWALFALGLLGAGIWKETRTARYAAIALLSVALLKLFFHDLARLEALYRIGALFAVAVIAILASVAYQRFLPGNEKTPPPQP